MAVKLQVPITLHTDDIDFDPNDPNSPNQSFANEVAPSGTGVSPQLNTNNVSSPSQSTIPSSNSGAPPFVRYVDPEMMSRLKTTLENPPLRSDYQPSGKRRFLAALAGAGAGFGNPKAGIEAANEINLQPYNQAYQDYLTKSGALEKGIGLQTEAQRSQYSGLQGLGSYINAENRGNPILQGDIAAAKTKGQEENKTTTDIKNAKFLENATPEEKETFQNYINSKRNNIQRPSSIHLSVKDAREQNIPINDINGQSIDTSKLPDNMEYRFIAGGPQGGYWIPDTQSTKVVTMNNQTSVIPGLTPTNPIVQGIARVPTVTSKEQIGQDPVTGIVGTQKLYSVATPQTPNTISPSIPTVQAPSTNTPNTQNIPNTQNSQTPTPRIVGSKAKLPPNNVVIPPGKSYNDVRPLSLMPPEVLKQQNELAIPLKAAATPILGDPTIKGSQSLGDFADLFDNKDSRNNTGTAIKLLLKSFDNSGEDSGYLEKLLGETWDNAKNIIGAKQYLAYNEVSNLDNVMNSLSAREKNFVDQVISAYGAVSGLRKSTAGGVYKNLIDSLKREIPAMGNAANSREFYNKLGLIGQLITAATQNSGISDQIMPQKDYYKQKTEEFLQKGAVPPSINKSVDRYQFEKVK